MGSSSSEIVCKLRGADLVEFARRFHGLPCWQVALSYGSVVRFEFGERLRNPFGDEDDVIGSATLWLEGDDWRIEADGAVLAESTSIDRAIAETGLPRAFLGQSIETLDASERSLVIGFSGRIKITTWSPEESEMDEGDDLVTLYAPDGAIAGFSVRFGFFRAAETDDFRASRFVRR